MAVVEATGGASPAWNRMPRETARAHEAAGLYFKMRANRSLAAVSKRLGKNVSLMERWSTRWDWVNRATAYDDHVARDEQNAIAKETAARAAEWRRRADERPEREYQRGQKLESKVDKMLDFPLTSIVKEDGKTTIRPARWKMRDVVPMINAASKMIAGAIQQAVGEEGSLVDEEYIISDYK
jgi:hypothetical protein